MSMMSLAVWHQMTGSGRRPRAACFQQGRSRTPGETVLSKLAVAFLFAVSLVALPRLEARAEQPPTKDWEVEITPYVWLTNFDGSVETRNGTEHFHMDMKDVLEDLDLGAMGRVSARWRRWIVAVDAVWAQLEQDNAFQRGPLDLKVDAGQTMTLVQALAGFRLYSRPGGLFGHAQAGDERTFGFDALAGVNYTYLSASFRFDRAPIGPLPGNERHFGASNDWFAPAVGARVQNDFTSRLRLETLATASGFNVGDAPDVTWVVTTLLSYRFTEHWLASLGHRAIFVEGDEVDVRMHGPMIGFGYRF